MIRWHMAAGRADDALAVVQDLSAGGQQASAAIFKDLLQMKVAQNDRRGMWRIVEEMQRAGVRQSGAFCAVLVKSLTSRSVPEDIRRVARLIEGIECQPDEVLVAAMVDAFMRISKLDVLAELMRGFRARGASMALASPTYGSLIKAYGQAGDVVCVQELWQEMEENGIRPTSITVGCVVEALVSNGEVQAAYQLVQKQLESAERRGVVKAAVFSTLLKGFASASDIDGVVAVHSAMREQGALFSTATFNTIIDVCAKACEMDRVAALLQDMVASGTEPDMLTFSAIVKGYCAQGDVERALSTLQEMRAEGKLAPDDAMYSSIMDAYAKQQRVEDALQLFGEMKQAGIAPSNCTLSVLVKAMGYAGMLDQAFQIVENHDKRRSNAHVYTCLLQGCVQSGDLDRAFALHDRLANEACPLDDKFYSVLARGCLQLRAPLQAADVVRIAYRLPVGQSRACPGHTAGVEPRALEEVVTALRAGTAEEQSAQEALLADLQRLRGVNVGDSPSTGSSPERRSGGQLRRGGRSGRGRH